MKVFKSIIKGHQCLLFKTNLYWYVVDTTSLVAETLDNYLNRIYGVK